MPLAAGSRLGPYEIQSLIRTGGMGEVYKEVAAHRMRMSSGTLSAVTAPTPWAWMKQARVAIPVACVLVALVSVGAWAWQRNARRWADEVAIPEIRKLADHEKYVAALALAHEAEQYIGGDRTLASALAIASRSVATETRPRAPTCTAHLTSPTMQRHGRILARLR